MVRLLDYVVSHDMKEKLYENIIHLIIALFYFPLLSCSTYSHIGSQNISPYSYGLSLAKTGEERYYVLMETHRAAVEKGVNVDYTGIEKIDIEIPVDAMPLPLSSYNDFCGCIFNVKNNKKKNFVLFESCCQKAQINVRADQIDKGDFRDNKKLRKGKFLLLIQDLNPWIKQRKGYSYGANRKDILLIKNGRAQNKTISNYNNDYSAPGAYVCPVENGAVIKNVRFVRDESSTVITRFVMVDGRDNVFLQDITIETPYSDLTGDMAIDIKNSTNVEMRDVNINGTYSKINGYGYGISLDNVWNVSFTRLVAKSEWGLFGNNNVNNCTLNNCIINRFDVHCYGRDIYFNNCTFVDLYNQFSSVFGDVIYNNCTFKNFVPVLIETSYNAFTEFDLSFKDCIFYITPEKNYLINTGYLDGEINPRFELMEKKLPKVHIDNLKVISLETGKEDSQVQLYLNRGFFIKERNIVNIIKL